MKKIFLLGFIVMTFLVAGISEADVICRQNQSGILTMKASCGPRETDITSLLVIPGPKGDQGEQGIQGEVGPQGPAGDLTSSELLIYSQHFFYDYGGFPENPNPPDPLSHPGVNFGAKYELVRRADGTPVSIPLFSTWYTFTYIYYYKLTCVYPGYEEKYPVGTPVCQN